jgi:hypothetical protein
VRLDKDDAETTQLTFRVRDRESGEGYVGSFAADDRWLYVGGRFTTLAGATTRNLARLDARTLEPAPWSDTPLHVEAIGVDENAVYVAGTTARRCCTWYVDRFDKSTGMRTRLGLGTGSVSSVLATNNLIYVGGSFGLTAFRLSTTRRSTARRNQRSARGEPTLRPVLLVPAAAPGLAHHPRPVRDTPPELRERHRLLPLRALLGGRLSGKDSRTHSGDLSRRRRV